MNFPAGRKVARLTANAAGAVVRSAVQVARGRPLLATEDEKARRVVACRACDCWIAATDRCSIERGGCGCWLPAKRALTVERCPRGVW